MDESYEAKTRASSSCFVPGIPTGASDAKQKLIDMVRYNALNFEEFAQKGDKNAAEIFTILNKNSCYTISRATIRCSKGYTDFYDTSRDPDFDLVLFILDELPPFDNVLEEFEKVLKRSAEDYVLQKITSHSIQFRLRDITLTAAIKSGSISFELFPAMNLLTVEEENLPQAQIEGIQTKEVLKLISELPHPRQNISMYSSSLAERYVTFVESQSEFVKDVIRLAKLWDRKVTWKGVKLEGRAVMIELVAISVALFEEVDEIDDGIEPNLGSAFQMFLKKFIRFDKTMSELFRCPANESLKLSQAYERYVRDTCDLGGPVILDPVNPFNNLARNVTVQIKIAFKVHAKVTLEAIQNYRAYSTGRYFNFEGFFGLNKMK